VGPFLALSALRERRWRPIAACGAVGLAFAVPFLVWDARAFVDNCLMDLLRKPAREDGLSWAAFSLRHGRLAFALIGALSYACYFGALAVLAGALRKSERRDSISLAWWTAALGLFGFFLFLKQSFYNYYYLVAGLLAFYPLLAGWDAGRDAEEKPCSADDATC
jgi:hypothetical protein